MGQMLGGRRSIDQCPFGCCGSLLAHGRRGSKRWHRLLRSREKRAWRSEVDW